MSKRNFNLSSDSEELEPPSKQPRVENNRYLSELSAPQINCIDEIDADNRYYNEDIILLRRLFNYNTPQNYFTLLKNMYKYRNVFDNYVQFIKQESSNIIIPKWQQPCSNILYSIFNFLSCKQKISTLFLICIYWNRHMGHADSWETISGEHVEIHDYIKKFSAYKKVISIQKNGLILYGHYNKFTNLQTLDTNSFQCLDFLKQENVFLNLLTLKIEKLYLEPDNAADKFSTVLFPKLKHIQIKNIDNKVVVNYFTFKSLHINTPKLESLIIPRIPELRDDQTTISFFTKVKTIQFFDMIDCNDITYLMNPETSKIENITCEWPYLQLIPSLQLNRLSTSLDITRYHWIEIKELKVNILDLCIKQCDPDVFLIESILCKLPLSINILTLSACNGVLLFCVLKSAFKINVLNITMDDFPNISVFKKTDCKINKIIISCHQKIEDDTLEWFKKYICPNVFIIEMKKK